LNSVDDVGPGKVLKVEAGIFVEPIRLAIGINNIVQFAVLGLCETLLPPK